MEQDFNNFAEEYREVHTANVQTISGADSYYFAEYKVKELLRFEEDIPAQLLDVGCGDGATEFFLQQYLPKIEVMAIDVSQKSIEIARSRKLPNVFFNLFDGSTIPFPGNSFDIVFVAGVLHHISPQNQKNIILEIYRVLKPKGRVYIFEHNPLNPFTRYLVKMCVFDKGVKLLYPATCKKILIQAGFSNISRSFTLFFPRKKIFKWFLKIENRLKHFPFGGQYYFLAKKD